MERIDSQKGRVGGVLLGWREAQIRQGVDRARGDFYIWGNCCWCDSITSTRLFTGSVVVVCYLIGVEDFNEI